MLIECKRTEKWRRHSASFTAYVSTLARALGVQRSVLWRDLGAVEFYLSLGGEFDGLQLPPLTTIEATTSAENLELIEKISRAAPRSLTRRLLQQLIAGTLTRSELRDVWRIYQAAAEPATERGRRPGGVKRGRSRTEHETGALLEANALYGLNHVAPAWAGTSNPAVYRVFTRPYIPRGPGGLEVAPDFIALVQKSGQADFVFHGIEFSLRPDETHAQQVVKTACFFDYFWTAIPASKRTELADPAEFLKILPRNIGLMQAARDEICVLRRPLRNWDARGKSLVPTLLLVQERQ